MKQYSIGAVAKLTGLTVHNLRVWEKRHSAVETARSESGRRIYNEGALKRLKLLKNCVDNGFNIGSIASLSNQELREIVRDFQQNEPVANHAPLAIWAVGSEASQLLDKLQEPPFTESKLTHFGNLKQLSSNHTGRADVLVIDQASLTAEETQKLAALVKKINAPHTVLMYRYSRQQDVSYLKSVGVHTLKAPVDANTLHGLLENLLQAPQGEPLLKPTKQAPPRIFSDNALNKAAAMTSSIDCECPQHLSELLKSLVGFEEYSADCETKDKKSADLHHHIYLRAAQARSILEDLMQTVLHQEGIDLSRVNH